MPWCLGMDDCFSFQTFTTFIKKKKKKNPLWDHCYTEPGKPIAAKKA